MLIPALLGLVWQTGNTEGFLQSALICIGAAAVFMPLGMTHRTPHLFTRQMFLITGGTWLLIPVFGSLPFVLTPLHVSVTDAVFETVSGLTTTGSTVFTGLDRMPRDILLWRSLLHWLGGVGIICMAVAILPFLKVGGMRLFKTESSHFTDDNVPRARQLVTSIITVYIGLSIACLLSYWVAGMSAFDAINHAMATLSTGGFSTSDSSFGQQSMVIHWIAILFMLSGAFPFVCYVQFAKGFQWRSLLNSQVRALLIVVGAGSLLLGLTRALTAQVPLLTAMTTSTFNLTSLITTTGFASGDYTQWGELAIALAFFATFIGGCSGSTSGGTKIFRFQILFALLRENLERAVHPRVTISKSYEGQAFGSEVVAAVAAYLLVLLGFLVVLTIALSATGLDLITSLTGAATALMNVGPGLGSTIGPAGYFGTLTDTAKWLLCIGMLMGRLEFLAILILFTPSFWRG
ncbi:MAG: hypothetical protein RLZZ385_2541 [Pseudomonadota bacterium]|jgi:trk system potassium uptake protein TrkH